MAEFSFVFVAMGQGDCCIVKCPDGKVVVVDCGSSANAQGDKSYFDQAKMQLRSWCATQGNKIAALILTHPDADHHNKVGNLFYPGISEHDITLPSGVTLSKPTFAHCNIDKIYFSSAAKIGGPLAEYNGNGLNQDVYSRRFATSELYEVTINSTNDSQNSYKKWSISDWFKTPTATAIPNKRLTILSGTTDGKNWSVSIIAGNVPKGYGGAIDHASEDNAKCLITLLEVDGKKALLTGDATYSTEKFLYDAHKDLLTNIEFAQVPHHGSAHGSSPLLVDTVRPKAAVVSVAFMEHSYQMPRYENVIERWLEVIEAHGAPIAPHDIDYWNGPSDNGKVKKVWNQWTNNDLDRSRVGHTRSKRFWFLWQPTYDYFGIYPFHPKEYSNASGYLLYRENVDLNLGMTSQKNHTYTLSDTGVTYTG